MSSIDNAIDDLIINTNHYNISLIIHELLQHKYYFNKEWYLSENNKPDVKASSLTNDIKNTVADRFLQRANHWEMLETCEKDQETMLRSKFKSIKLLQLVDKLKNNDRFIKDLIIELKSFFSIN